MPPRRSLLILPALALPLALFPVVDAPAADALVERRVEPVVLTGAQLAAWSQLPALGTANPDPTVGRVAPFGDGRRDAHNGTVTAPPADARTGVDPSQVVAYRVDGTDLVEIPVQVDQRFPYFLANGRSEFSHYSGTDMELTYQWDVERWKMTGGECVQDPAEGAPALDPVAAFDDDDELVFMAGDAGPQAGTPPAGSLEVALTDPVTDSVSFVYLAVREGGPSTTERYVDYERDDDAGQWIDRGTFADDDPEKIGSSNTGYGPNLEGTVCDPDGTVRPSTDRFPRDGVTVTTDAYRWHATGRWMVRELHVARTADDHDGGHGHEHRHGRGHGKTKYGPDLIDRWKGRAFQSSPDSTISVVGFEDEQVNWEANSALLGERAGPVRAIRETWGADSGTNVTKTETFYRDAITYRYRLRVHPIPPDGLYTSWDYNAGVATRYFNVRHPEGVAIDGVNDDVGQVDSIGGTPAFFDAPDPTFDLPSALLRWEQVSGRRDAGSLVYVTELKGATSAANPAVVAYYRDDACFDDGTGDDPVTRPWPGEPSTDPRVTNAYAAMAGVPYEQVTCAQKQGAWGANGLHFFFTHDTDNALVGAPAPLTEVDAQQWQFAVPTREPVAVGEPYAQVVRAPLVVGVVPR